MQKNEQRSEEMKTSSPEILPIPQQSGNRIFINASESRNVIEDFSEIKLPDEMIETSENEVSNSRSSQERRVAPLSKFVMNWPADSVSLGKQFLRSLKQYMQNQLKEGGINIPQKRKRIKDEHL